MFRLQRSHLGLSRFRQTGKYKKKTPSTKRQVKDIWRELKGFDHNKGDIWCKCGRLLKSWGNRQNRRWERKMIKSEKFDEIFWHQDMFVSSWDAC